MFSKHNLMRDVYSNTLLPMISILNELIWLEWSYTGSRVEFVI